MSSSGAVLSRRHLISLATVLPLADLATQLPTPTPSGKGRLHALPHEKGMPFKSPLMKTSNPWGSLASSSRVASPRHQPAFPHRLQSTRTRISGGIGVEVGEETFVGMEVWVGVNGSVSTNVGVKVIVGVNVRVWVGVKV
jgi:hypothetical protein